MANKQETTRLYNWANAQKITMTATSAQSTNAFGATEVVIFATQNAWITSSLNPTAVKDDAGNMYLTAGVLYHMTVNSTWKLAAIRDSADGSVHIIPCD